MATGGIFQLITNDGRQDRMLMATSLLKKRLQLIEQARRAASLPDATPTLVDIEKTHILFTNAHFKPFAAIGYEYNKVRASSGTAQLGSTVQFSIPQFGDFFHDMVLHLRLKQPVLTSTALLPSDAPSMRWCAFPGERVMKKVQFEVNGNPLDEYTSYAYNFYREYCVPPHKRTGWYRCVGQELPWHGTLNQPGDDGELQSVAATSHRFAVEVLNGPQTPSPQKDTTDAGDLELFIPFLFWFNKDPRLAIPSVAIPYGQRFINVELATAEELVTLWPRGAGTFAAPQGSLDRATNLIRTIELYINNIFVNPEIHDIFIKRIGFTLIRVHRQQLATVAKSTDEILLQQLKWPIETLFVGMKVKDYSSTNPALQSEHVDKWHRFSQVVQTPFANAGVQGYRQVALTQTNITVTAVTGVIAGAGTAFNTELAPGDVLVAPNGETFTVGSVGSATAGVTTNVPLATVGPLAGWTALRPASQGATADVMNRTIDTLTIKAHGISIYSEFPAGFYNAYVPLHYGGPNVQTPEDVGAMMINFCLYPGTYQPSGHINVSRAREFYLTYVSNPSIINSANEGVLVVLASAINFLLISDGSAVLRYST
jgi:hypothetical protein